MIISDKIYIESTLLNGDKEVKIMKGISIILFILSLLLCVNYSSAYNLEDFPEMFEKDGENDVKIVIPGADTYFSIAYSILNNKLMIPAGIIPESKDIDDLNQNMILIGNACENSIVDELRNFPKNCRKDLSKGEGKAEIIERGDHHILIIEGYDWKGLLEVSKSLTNRSLSGKIDKVKAVVNSDDPLGHIFLRQNRLNHFQDDGNDHTFKFTEVSSNKKGIIEIDGQVQEQNNEICPYNNNQGLIPKSTKYVTLEVKKCKGTEQQIFDDDQKDKQDLNSVSSQNKGSNNSYLSDDSNIIGLNQTEKDNTLSNNKVDVKNEGNIFFRLINWFKSLLS